MQKTGQIERTVDRQFEDEEAKYRVYARFMSIQSSMLIASFSRYEKECQALQKDSKAYWDAMRGESILLSTKT
jgi:amphiphysin